MLAAALAGSALAAVPADEAKQLGGAKLTAWGAEKAGNKEGTIPAYTGDPLKAPANYDVKKPGQHPSPFAGEKPLFTITAQNYAQYADKLDGSAELFKRYPDYRMKVYPSHRNFVYPQWVLDNTVKNAAACKGTDNELKACIRWELHRVWVVEAMLKPGYRHVYKKRVFFWDEDIPGHGTAENYDAAGKLYRITLNTTYQFYSAPGGVGGSVADAPVFMDTQTGVWGFSGVGSCADPQCGNRAIPDMPKDYWSPESMAASGVR